MRVFVAGATGVLGRRVVPALTSADYCVTANVRNAAAAAGAAAAGATTATVDLFDAATTMRLSEQFDAIVNVATSIPTGAAAALRRGWRTNDRLRTDAAANLAAAMAQRGGRYVGESITFPYESAGDEWIDESHPCSYFWGNESCAAAERAAASVTDAGGTGVALRFAMFFADDSKHGSMMKGLARRGVFPIPGAHDAHTSFVHVDDAADAVVAALQAPAGLFNVAEPDPARRIDHSEALARAVGRSRLRRIPDPVVRLGSAAAESLSRSQRISSQALIDATDWEPRYRVVDAWSG